MRAAHRVAVAGLAVAGLLAAWVTSRVAAGAAAPAPGGWNLVFSDNFTGPAGSPVNSANWRYTTGTSYPGGPPNFGTNEVETMTASTANVALDGTGNLRITPQRGAAGNWTSGRIETKRTDFQPPAGGKLRVEARIQMPDVSGAAAAGYWPAFWMLGAPFRGNFWNWPGVGEFDVMENVNGINNEWATMHCGVAPGGPCNEFTGIGGQRACGGTPCQGGFHTYTMEWDRSVSPEVVRFSLDGAQFHQVSAANMDPATWAAATGHGFFLILNVAMGGAFPAALGGGPTPATQPGHPMVVDYVAVWQAGAGGAPSPPPNPGGGGPSPDYTQQVTALNARQAKVSFHPTTPVSLVDVHYLVNGANQQNFRMTDNGGTWEQTVSNLSSGTVLDYWFTYEKGGPLFDTPHFSYTHSGGGGGGPGTFPITFQNNTHGKWSNGQIFVTTLYLDAGNRWNFLQPNGSGHRIDHTMASAPGHLTKNGVNYPNMSFTLAQASTVSSPTSVRGGRVYLSVGTPMFIGVSPDDQGWAGPDLNNPGDPNTDVIYDWYEYTYVANQVSFGGNTTSVDQFGLPLTAHLVQTSTGYDTTRGITQTRDQVFAGYRAAVGPAFQGLANQFRIVAPRSASAFKPGGAQAGFLQAFIDQVWNFYAANQWTENDHGVVYTGKVVNGVLTGTRTSDGQPFTVRKPTTTEVFECSGALALGNDRGGTDLIRAVGRDLCAALHRGVALNTAFWFDPTTYYRSSPRDDYAAYFHSIGIDHRSYAFAYDDVNDQSSVQILSRPTPPTSLTLGIGW